MTRFYMCRKAFSLIELVMVIVVLGILAVAIITASTSKGSIRLHAACQRVASDLRYVQQMAIAQQVRFGISFDPPDESYIGYRINTSNRISDPHTRGDLEIEFDEMSQYNDIRILSTNFSGNDIEFDSLGAPYNGSGVALSSRGIITLETADGEYSKTVTIEPDTGKVSIE